MPDVPDATATRLSLPRIGTGRAVLFPMMAEPDGSLIVEADEHVDGRQVNAWWRVPADLSAPIHLRDGPALAGVAHQRKALAFSAEHLGGVFVGNIDSEGEDRKIFSTPADMSFIDWSPDDQNIAVVTQDSQASSIFVISADGRSAQHIFAADAPRNEKRRITWYGQNILYTTTTATNGDSKSQLMSTDPSGAHIEHILDLPEDNVSPLLVHDNNLVLIASTRDEGIRFQHLTSGLEPESIDDRVRCPSCVPIGWREEELIVATAEGTTLALSPHSGSHTLLDARPLAVTSAGKIFAARRNGTTCALVDDASLYLAEIPCDARIECARHVERCLFDETRDGRRTFSWLEEETGRRSEPIYRLSASYADALLSPDASTLALVDDMSATFVALRDGTARHIDAEHENRGATFDAAGDGLIIAAVLLDGPPFGLYRLTPTGKFKARTIASLPFSHPALSPDGRVLAIADRVTTNTLSEVGLKVEAY